MSDSEKKINNYLHLIRVTGPPPGHKYEGLLELDTNYKATGPVKPTSEIVDYCRHINKLTQEKPQETLDIQSLYNI